MPDDAESARLHELLLRRFTRRGASLDAAGKAELGRINTELSNAFTGFGQKVVADENTWTVIADEAGLKGLPESIEAPPPRAG